MGLIATKEEMAKQKASKKRKADPSQINTEGLEGRYLEMANNNPWLKMEYEPSEWDTIVEAFGGRSNAMKRTEEFANNANLYNEQLRQLQGEEKYNSAEAQAQRLREAGLNPDLTGGVEAGEAGQFDNQATDAGESGETGGSALDIMKTMTNNLQEGINMVSGFCGNLSTAMLSAMGAINELKKGKNLDIENSLKMFNLTSNIWDLNASEHNDGELPGGISISSFIGNDENGNPILDLRPKNSVKNEWMRSDYANAMFKNRKNREEAFEYFWSMAHMAGNYVAESERLNKIAKNQKEKGEYESYGNNNSEIRKYFEPIRNAEKAAADALAKYYSALEPKQQAYAENAKNRYNVKYWFYKNGKDQAESENEIARMNKAKAELEKSLQETYGKTVKQLAENAANSNNFVEQFLNTYIMSVFNKIMQEGLTPSIPNPIQNTPTGVDPSILLKGVTGGGIR